jgi:CRISPR-associated protein Cas1
MIKLKNTLFITTQGSYLHKEQQTLVIKIERKKALQLPIHSINNIFCFGNVMVSPFLLGFCGENNIGLIFYSEYGKFLARIQGSQSGNIFLRKQQFTKTIANDLDIARNIIATKIANSRTVLQRHIRNHGTNEKLTLAIKKLSWSKDNLKSASNKDSLIGIEGEAAAIYFSVFSELIRNNSTCFVFKGRNRRPPLDATNALLSFVYSLLGKEISSALQGVGLDPQAGFLHADRSGRDSLAQDILEEFRAYWADRLVLSLINRKQVSSKDFSYEASGAVLLNDKGRKILLTAYQEKKQQKIIHPYLEEEVPIGILPHLQAQLLARHLRGDLAAYPPFVMR